MHDTVYVIDLLHSTHTLRPTNAATTLDSRFYAAVLQSDIIEYPLNSGALARMTYANGQLTELQLDTERIVGRFVVDVTSAGQNGSEMEQA